MQLLPDWAPNIHPMVIHFPIVLLIVAVFFDVLCLFIKKVDWLGKSALILYLLGTISLITAFLTGRSASDGLEIPTQVIPVATDHADWAEITLWFFIVYTIIRLFVGLKFKPLKPAYFTTLILISFIGIYFLYQTADHGAKLVFGYGLGTGNIITAEIEAVEIPEDLTDYNSALILNKDGSWKFTSSPAAVEVLKQKFEWVKNSVDELSPMFDQKNNALMFHPSDEVMFIQKSDIKSIEMKTAVNIDDFNGELKLVHHYLDNDNYDFLRIQNSKIALGRKSKGQIRIFEEGNFSDKGWIEIKVVSDKTHFHGYIDNKMIVHGHGSEPETGSAGMLIDGSGSLLLRNFEVISLR